MADTALVSYVLRLALWMQTGLGAVLAATIAVTSPMAYAAPFDTGTDMAPLGKPRTH